MLDTGALTDLLITRLADSGVLVGDGVAPHDGGWSKGQPRSGRFVPYSTLSFSGASVRIDQLASLQDEDWDASFSIKSFGGSRKQVDWQSNAARVVAHGGVGAVFGSYRVAKVSWQSLGGVSRVDSTDPPYWQAADSFSLLCVCMG